MRKVLTENLPRTKSGRIKWIDSFGKSVRFIYDDIEGVIEILNIVDDNKSKINILYKEQKYVINKNQFVRCNLGRVLGKKTNEFKHSINETIKDERKNLTIIGRFKEKDKKGQNKKYYNYICNSCGYDSGRICESNLKTIKCPCCTGKVCVEGVNDIPTTAPWMVKYFQDGYNEAKKYTKSSGRKIIPVCPECGEIRITPISVDKIYMNNGFGCVCKDGMSYPNKFMYNLLTSNNIEFINEYSPEWIRNKFYDFYLPDLGIMVEMDGIMHSKESTLTNLSLYEIQENDKYKDDKALENNITVLRIDSFYSKLDYIKNSIISSNLLNILKIKDIDWNAIEELSRKSFYKKVWDLKHNNPNMFSGEIASELKISSNSVRRALRLGHELGKCYYNQKEEAKRSSSYGVERKSIGVKISKDRNILFEYNSLSEMYGKSIVDIGFEIRPFVFNKHIKPTGHYKGYDFEFIYPNKKTQKDD